MARHSRSPILLTAFEPFGGEAINPAQEVLRLMPDRLRGREIRKLLLPTAFAPAGRLLRQAMDRCQPGDVVMLGQAGGRAGITVERVAVNLQDADIPDNLGASPRDLPIWPGGPAAYFATLPTRTLVGAIRSAGQPAALSYSAGTFVCNHVLYTALRHIERSGLSARAGFIHLPFLPEQARGRKPLPPSLSLRDQARGILALLNMLCSSAPGERGSDSLRPRRVGKARFQCE